MLLWSAHFLTLYTGVSLICLLWAPLDIANYVRFVGVLVTLLFLACAVAGRPRLRRALNDGPLGHWPVSVAEILLWMSVTAMLGSAAMLFTAHPCH